MASGQFTPVLRYLHRLAEPVLTDAQLLDRFRASRDEAAFEMLVRRHGPLVQGVCRRVLRDWHAAQDAFQAVFLILARKAATLERPDSLGPWLYGVAYRTALKARSQAARQSAHERCQRVDVATADSTEEVEWRDLRPVLDAEIHRLPERYRKPFVLSYLQGKTNAEVARLLGCSRGTVATLLARARQRLRQRLSRRGLTLSLTLTVSAVPTALHCSTAHAAALFGAGQIHAAGAVSASAVTLAQGVLRAMMANKLRWGAIVLLAVGMLGTGAGVISHRAGADEPDRPAATPTPVPISTSPPPAPVVTAVPPAPAPMNPPGFVNTTVPPAVTGSTVYGTANFEVTAPTLAIARRVGQAAEQHRARLAYLWLGRQLPTWPKPCLIEVLPGSTGCGGATSFVFENGRVTECQMRLQGKLETILADALPHEITHTVLADRFTGIGHTCARWADEGAALLAESSPSQARTRAALSPILNSHRRIPLRRLLAMYDFPPDVMALYGEGYSLTRFLLGLKDRETFLAFVARDGNGGWDKSVEKYYGYHSVGELEKAWLAQARKDLAGRVQPTSGETLHATEPGTQRSDSQRRPHGRLPAGPAPVQALVLLREDGRLLVWYTGTAYEPRTHYMTIMTSDDNGHTRTTATPVTSYEAIRHQIEVHYTLDQVKVYDHLGKPVDVKTVPKLLKGETLALFAFGADKVDPLHLRLVKPGTLLFVLEPPTPVPAGPSAVPVAPPAGRP
ncbi:MAG TPA: sigma-70 family RNA polymerase sigma factor [Gemmataceae bacterium]|nr:sigma-70 family RNA polymerase sigma factor [Gemmataceae bacterium]